MKKHLKIAGLAGIAAGAMMLASCAGNYEGNCYILQSGSSYGYTIARVSATVNSGTIVDAKVEEMYLPSLWARVDASSSIPHLTVSNVKVGDGTVGELNFATHIQIGKYTFTGTVRSSDSVEYSAGDYINYTADQIIASNVSNTLNYLVGNDSIGFQLGTTAEAYWNSIVNKDFSLLSFTGEEAPTDWKNGANVVKNAVADPSVGFYRSVSDTTWFEQIGKLNSFIVGLKKLNFAVSAEIDKIAYHSITENADGTYSYNTGIVDGVNDPANVKKLEGVTSSVVPLVAMENYFMGYYRAFASQEFISKR